MIKGSKLGSIGPIILRVQSFKNWWTSLNDCNKTSVAFWYDPILPTVRRTFSLRSKLNDSFKDYKIIFYHFHKLSQKHLKYLFGQETTH